LYLQVDGLLARWSGLLGTSPISFDDAEQAYSQSLQPLAVGVFDSDAPGAYNSQFKALASQQEGECFSHLVELVVQMRAREEGGRGCRVVGLYDISQSDSERDMIAGVTRTLQPVAVGVFDADAPGAYNIQCKALAIQGPG
jgi:hypothetical protein